MAADYSMLKYYKGEANNPFDHEKQNTQSMFWFYESVFESNYLEGIFTGENWIPPGAADFKEWETVLNTKPIDKEELFKLWLFFLLMDRLPDKYGTPGNDEFLRLYWDTKL